MLKVEIPIHKQIDYIAPASYTRMLVMIGQSLAIFSASSALSALMMQYPVNDSIPIGKSLVPEREISFPWPRGLPGSTILSPIDANHFPHASCISGVGVSYPYVKNTNFFILFLLFLGFIFTQILSIVF